ncbi:MAG TPA: serine/threonine-protein kinase, partial [Vicinamibacterales bacterium]|nr:serine/threonine-protein kinase [Vicinamibacterales bacterium]
MSGNTERLNAALSARYRIEKQLGQGGMATVYLAQDLKHDRKVAVKVLKPELAAVLGAERFVVEIKTTAALQHPHILPLFDSGTADGFLYYVMPYIDGETLRNKLDRETQLGIAEAVKITTDVADALDYAHRHGVIHRDIKPENILLHDGRPVVADFGIALALSAAAGGRMTETGLSLGTPHYMSPEQATAEKEITNRSDIYSLGCVLYEMLTGNPPHVGSSAQQIIMRILTEEVPPVTKLRKAVPPHVAAALIKALERLPADRFEDARSFAAALTDAAFTLTALGGGALSAASAGGAKGWRPRLRDPFVVAPSLAAAALAVLVATSHRRPSPSPVPPIRFVLTGTDSTRP